MLLKRRTTTRLPEAHLDPHLITVSHKRKGKQNILEQIRGCLSYPTVALTAGADGGTALSPLIDFINSASRPFGSSKMKWNEDLLGRISSTNARLCKEQQQLKGCSAKVTRFPPCFCWSSVKRNLQSSTLLWQHLVSIKLQRAENKTCPEPCKAICLEGEKDGVRHFKLEILLGNTTSECDGYEDWRGNKSRKKVWETRRGDKTRREESLSELLPRGEAAISRLSSSIFQFQHTHTVSLTLQRTNTLPHPTALGSFLLTPRKHPACANQAN